MEASRYIRILFGLLLRQVCLLSRSPDVDAAGYSLQCNWLVILSARERKVLLMVFSAEEGVEVVSWSVSRYSDDGCLRVDEEHNT